MPTARFDKAEQSILEQLLHADRNTKDSDQMIHGARPIPQLVIEAAARSLIEQGLLLKQRSPSGYTVEYVLTPTGQDLMLAAWKAQNG